MTDRVPGAPGQYQMVITQEQFALLQKGQKAVVNIKRDDKPITEGTPYSKKTVLPDELAKKICPDTLDPTPADAFANLITSDEAFKAFLEKNTTYVVRPDTPGQLGAYGQVWSRLGNTLNAYKGDNYYIAADAIGRIWSGYQLNGANDITWIDQSAGEDIIVAEGTSGTWGYRKWASGIAECWNFFESSGNIDEPWGSLFEGCTVYGQPYPFTFKDVPNEFVHVSTAHYAVIPCVEKRNTTIDTARYSSVRPTAVTNETVRYNVYVIGRWK